MSGMGRDDQRGARREVSASTSGLTQAQADARYVQLNPIASQIIRLDTAGFHQLAVQNLLAAKTGAASFALSTGSGGSAVWETYGSAAVGTFNSLPLASGSFLYGLADPFLGFVNGTMAVAFNDGGTFRTSLRVELNGIAVGLVGNTFGSYAGAKGVMFLRDAAVIPVGNPANGGLFYSVAGAATWKGSAGTVTTMAPA